jgi:alpha-ribazole phosphatase
MKIVLIRHGLTAANERRLYCGSTDLPLSENGVKGITERVKRGIYPPHDGCALYTSGMLRTEQTLSLIYGDIPRHTDFRLRELDFGDFELRSYEELKDDPAYIRWISGDNEKNTCPNGESGEAMKRRVIAALDAYIKTGDNIIAVTHGGVIVAVMEALFPGEGKNRYQWQPAAGGGYEITILESCVSYTEIA